MYLNTYLTVLLLGLVIFNKIIRHWHCTRQDWTSDQRWRNLYIQTPFPLKEEYPWGPWKPPALLARSPPLCAWDPQESDQACFLFFLPTPRSTEHPAQQRGGEPGESRPPVPHLSKSPLQRAECTESYDWGGRKNQEGAGMLWLPKKTLQPSSRVPQRQETKNCQFTSTKTCAQPHR